MVVLYAPEVTKPVAVRYAFRAVPLGEFQNGPVDSAALPPHSFLLVEG
jgi:hypothetical protein